MRRAPVELVDDWLVYQGSNSEWSCEQLPDELALRELLAVDVWDPESVHAFVESYGVIARTAAESELPWRDLPPPPPAAADDPHAEVLEHVLLAPLTVLRLPIAPHWAEVALHLLHAQHLALHAIATLRGDETVPAWQGHDAVPLIALLHGESTIVPRVGPSDLHVTAENQAGIMFVLGLNRGLRWCSMRVEAQWRRSGAEAEWLAANGHENAWRQLAPDPPDLYTALCMQLANVVAEEPTLKACPECGCAFVRQRGRAKHGQHRTKGLTYCSVSCGNRKRKREQRHRQAKAAAT